MACANGGCFDIQESSETTYSSNRKFSPVAELCEEYHIDKYA